MSGAKPSHALCRDIAPVCVIADTRRVLRHLWWILGLALTAGGVIVAVSSQASSSDFGWFASTPLSDDSDWRMGWGDPMGSGSALIVSRWQLAGCAVAATGLIVLAGGIGFRLGRRRSALREQP